MIATRVNEIRQHRLLIEDLIRIAAASRSQRLLCELKIYCETLNGTGIFSVGDWATIAQALDKLRQDAAES